MKWTVNMFFYLFCVTLFYERFTLCLQIIPERGSVTYFNEAYMYNASGNVRRYGRKSGYYVNISGTTKHTWDNNVTIHLIMYEFLHNEYKRSFVEFHFSLCDMIRKDPYLGKAMAEMSAKYGIPCPAPAGVYTLSNISIPADNFPNVWPFERCKTEITLQQLPTKDIIVKGVVYVTFKQKLGK